MSSSLARIVVRRHCDEECVPSVVYQVRVSGSWLGCQDFVYASALHPFFRRGQAQTDVPSNEVFSGCSFSMHARRCGTDNRCLICVIIITLANCSTALVILELNMPSWSSTAEDSAHKRLRFWMWLPVPLFRAVADLVTPERIHGAQTVVVVASVTTLLEE